ncbi:hypothetical protein D9R10_19665 [Bacillus velezensis]|nr:hypothetical protein D9R10_19665 [Bacillus velezensis]
MLAKENKQCQSTYSDNLYKNIIEGAKKEPMFQEYLETEYFREKAIDKIKAYTRFLNSITHKHKIAANLHLIKAAGNKEKKIMINSFYIIGETLLREQCIIIMDSGNMVKCFQRIIYQEIRH